MKWPTYGPLLRWEKRATPTKRVAATPAPQVQDFKRQKVSSPGFQTPAPPIRVPRMPQTCPGSPDAEDAKHFHMMRQSGYTEKQANHLIAVGNSIGKHAADWPRRPRDAVFALPYINHVGRLTLLGFVIGNGGNLHELKLFLAERGMLREPSSWADLSTIERDLKGDPAFRESSYYWDIIHNGFCNFTGTRVGISVP